jgi:hypothetical protein
MPGVRLKNPPGFEIDAEQLCTFEHGLDPRHPERSTIPTRVLGYGEISTVFAIQTEGFDGLAFKRLPIFQTEQEMVDYLATHEEYNRLLEEEIGLCISPHGHAAFITETGRPIFYIIQQREIAESIGHRAIHLIPAEQAGHLFRRVLGALLEVWEFNRGQDRVQVAIDGQISNWAIQGFDPARPVLPDSASLCYLDTSTPLFRVAGIEQLDPELFLRSAPSFLRWVLRLLFLKDVVNRYYDFHLVTVDLIANFYKEQRPELIPDLVRIANTFFSKDAAGLGVQPLTEKEIADYYREDKLIWTIYLVMRKLDRFLHMQVLRHEYPYILPGVIKR